MDAPLTEGDTRLLRGRATAMLRHNRKRARHPDGRLRGYTCPSPGHYAFQWFWDSCFHAVALAHLEPEAVREELALLTSAQAADGFLPHVIFWERARLLSPGLYWAWLQSRDRTVPRRSALIGPPVLAAALERHAEITGDGGPLEALLPALDRYFAYLGRQRTPDNSPLIAIIAPRESGMDHKPSYDRALGLPYPAAPRDLVIRPRLLDLANRATDYDIPRLLEKGRFLVQDVLVNCVYADGLASLARMHARRGDRSAGLWRERAGRVEAAIRSDLRGRDGFFYDRDAERGRLLRVRTVAGLMPLLVGSLTDAEVAPLLAALDDPRQFATPYPIPSVAVHEPAFVPDALTWGAGPLIWRGPTWINSNWLLWRALRRRGDLARAARIAHASARLVLPSGFREYYHPFAGEGFGATSFGWSALVVDMLA